MATFPLFRFLFGGDLDQQGFNVSFMYSSASRSCGGQLATQRI